MTYETKDMTGSLFQNRKKESDKHPDMTGTIVVNGVKYRVAAWGKTSDTSGKWLSMKVSELEERQEPKPTRSASKFGDLADDIPFSPLGKYE